MSTAPAVEGPTADGESTVELENLHRYFCKISDARYIVRRVFRLIDEHARAAGLDPLEHQALIQLFGSPDRSLQMKVLADRLDVGSDVASKVVKALQEKGYARRSRSETDRRGINVAATVAGERRLASIDLRVREHITMLRRSWPRPVQLNALEMFAFYAGLSIDSDDLAGIEVGSIELAPPWSGVGGDVEK